MYKLRLDSNSNAGRRDAHIYSYCSSARFRTSCGYCSSARHCTSYAYSYRPAAIAGQPCISIFDPPS